MRDIFLDIESTGLNAESSQLIAIGFLSDSGTEEIFFVNKPKEEKKVIENLFEFLALNESRVITYYGSYYDIPFIVSRALHLGVNIKEFEIFPLKQIDVYDVVKNTLKLNKNSLSDVCKFLRIKKEFTVDGKDMPNIYLKVVGGDEEIKEKIKAHLKDDIKTLKEVWDKLLPVINTATWEK